MVPRMRIVRLLLGLSLALHAGGAIADEPLNIITSIADLSNNRIRRVDVATGTISSVAGIGQAAFGGEGGPAPAARLNIPRGMCIDPDGNLFSADQGNNRVRFINLSVAPVALNFIDPLTG